MAGRQGFEPRFCGSEPHVLPLNDLPAGRDRRLPEAARGGQPWAGWAVFPRARPAEGPQEGDEAVEVAAGGLSAHHLDEVEERRARGGSREGHAGGVDQDSRLDPPLLGQGAQGGVGGVLGEVREAGVAVAQGVQVAGEVGVLQELGVGLGVVGDPVAGSRGRPARRGP